MLETKLRLSPLLKVSVLSLAAVSAFPNLQAQPASSDDTTVTYPGEFFTQYAPLTVNDMLDRVPGIELILDSGGPSADGDRGLGATSSILIDGKRLAGKANEARSQLDRIAADQVQYIEIVRGTSASLDVQNSGQLVNIVLLESQSQSNLSTEVSAKHFEDGTIDPGLSLAWSGQSGSLTYLLSGSMQPAYQHTVSLEQSVNGDFSPHEIITFDRFRRQTDYSFNSNLTWDLGGSDRLALNALYNQNDPPTELFRTITNLDTGVPLTRYERETLPASADNWEVGADYQNRLANGDRFKALIIVNEKNDSITRERFTSATLDGEETKNLFLDTNSQYSERILRTSYTFSPGEGQGLEMGFEVAQTTQDSNLKLGVLTPGPGSADFGGLTPVSFNNALSTVEEIRIEPFAIHNWQINPRMSLESSVVGELSEIEQSGDVTNNRKFSFLKPKLDFRFNLNPSLQLRSSLEKFVGQLSFADFSQTSNTDDDDQNTNTGNPTLEPEESIRFELGLDYRLPNDSGTLNSRYFHYRFDNKIGQIDISTPTFLDSTNGNIGRADAYGVRTNFSLRLGFLGLGNALLTGSLTIQESDIEVDPFTNRDAHFFPYDRGGYNFGFRQDFTSPSLSWGLSFRERIDGNRVRQDIDNEFELAAPQSMGAFFEIRNFLGGLTYRLEANNIKNAGRCFNRFRYAGDRRTAPLSEVENICSTTGPEFAILVRGNF